MAASEETNFKVEKLTADNYHSWKFNMKMYLIGKDLWDIVKGDEEIDDDASAEEKRKFKKRENVALAAVCLSISQSLQIYVRSADNAKSAWDILEKHFQRNTLSRKIHYRRKLYSARMEKGANMIEHINSIKVLSEHLEAIDDAITEKDLVIILISSLPDEYNYLITALETIDEEKLQWDYVRDRLIHEAEKMSKASLDAEHSPHNALVANSLVAPKSSATKDFKCHYCKRKGHYARDCYKKKADTAKNSQQKGEAVGKFVADIDTTDRAVALISSRNSNKSSWWIDSGASQHMTYDRKTISDYVKFEKPMLVRLADDSTLNCYGKGNVHLTVKDNAENVNILLKDVLYVPKLQNKLFSLPSIIDKGAVVQFKGQHCEILIDEKKFDIGHKHGKLYKLNAVIDHDQEFCCFGNTSNSNKPIQLWHQRFGHLGYQNLNLLNDKSMVDGMNITMKCNIDEPCEACVMGKQHREPFPKKSESKTREVLELIHSDVNGPLPVNSLGGSRYFVTFIDDYSRYTTVYTLKSKDEVLEKFKEFVKSSEKQTGHSVKALRSDNGGEYVSNAFKDYCKSSGIRQEFTIPYSPQQNGVAERANRTIMESVRSMLFQSSLPSTFWAEAVSTAVYLKNRSPSSYIKDSTPYERWHEKKPDVGNLRVFGCNAFVHIPKEKRHGKLDPRSNCCVFVGYPNESKGYKLYNLETKQMLRSRDVIFMEDKFCENFCQGDIQNNPAIDNIQFDDLGDTSTSGSNDQADDTNNIPQRPQRERNAPERLGAVTGEWNFVEEASVAVTDVDEPRSIKQALDGPNSKHWSTSTKEEIDSLLENKTWDLTELPPGKNVVGSKWVFKHKRDANGNINRFKARLVAQGYSQEYGLDYDEVFAPVAKFNSIRTVLAIANELDLEVHQMDVKTAFLNGDLDCEIYMKQPEGFVDPDQPEMVCKLHKSIYGLKQAARCWNKTIDSFLKESGYSQSDADPCIYYKCVNKRGKQCFIIMALYVDDLIISSNDSELLIAEKQTLSSRFQMEDQGEIHFCLGMSIKRNRKEGTLTIDQKSYLHSVLRRFGMSDCKPVSTPMEAGKVFEKIEDENGEPLSLREYQAIIGCLTYASIATRPDICASVGVLSRFMTKPGQQHWTGVKRVLRYIKGTLNFSLKFESIGEMQIRLSGYADADWAGDVDTRKSTSGYVFRIGSSTVSWSSKRQTVVALSTTEAEYVSLSYATQETVWLRKLLGSIGFDQHKSTILHEDNQSTIALIKNPKHHARTKHIDIKYHFIRQSVDTNCIEVKYCCTDNMIADIMTKSLPRPKFEKLRAMLGIVDS